MNNLEKMLQMFETIPRENEKAKAPDTAQGSETTRKMSKEEKAIADMRELLQYLEKQVKGTLDKADKEKMSGKRKEFQESIAILRDVVSKNEI